MKMNEYAETGQKAATGIEGTQFSHGMCKADLKRSGDREDIPEKNVTRPSD